MYERSTVIDIWTFREPQWATAELEGFKVEAIDGSIGKVDRATSEAGTSHLVVDTGPWILGKKVILPAGVISGVNLQESTVSIDLTKDQVQNAPEFDELKVHEPTYRDEIGSYYGANRPAGPDYGKDDRPAS